MPRDALDIVRRNMPTLAQDFLGGAALVALFLAALSLPGAF